MGEDNFEFKYEEMFAQTLNEQTLDQCLMIEYFKMKDLIGRTNFDQREKRDFIFLLVNI